MKKIIFTLLFSAMVPGAVHAKTCMTEDPFPFETQYNVENCPDDIQSLLNRMNTCAHLEGEYAYDTDRKTFLDDAMVENRCGQLGCDFQQVFSTHEGDIVYTGILFEYARVVYGSDENMPECTNEDK